ncbi:Versicolorin B synthase [Cercospora beticola]|uniref:Versicolorin B synthase n=1 Tax=Cercospora beticola TaxID=122368 RepID=A0A2G5H9G1_CERBT|nr:Versicolorin B synthase [Cercospora beticola]PIA89176.1 Versicolorin B synthase [Cercospora beticola]WPB03793.1 hypothetical protein RHO25_008437 [Cercospora beticola]CAK1357440.1 unnamed protein product [Cercospora beticola]
MARSLLTSLVLFSTACQSQVVPQYSRPGQLTGTAFGIPGVNAEYDYVIVGAGIAGSVVAARLTEHSNATVALIEAGGFYEFGNGNWSQIPAYSNRWIRQAPDMPQQLIDWGLRTEPQVNGRVIRYTQGKNLGGSSGRNQMLYHRGSEGSYDAWAEKVGDDAYRWENMLPFFKRTMQFSPNAERRPENTAAGVYDADAYSAEGGPLQVSLPAYVEPVSNYAPAVFEAMGLQRQPGSSSGRLDGYAWWQYTVDPETGLRSSAESSLLQQAFGRPSLTTYINAQARNIVFNDTKATGVNVTINGQYPFILSARKEVISAAGAWHSPQLLMVSGIGPRSTLESLNISVVSDLPGVGQHIHDSCSIGGPSYEIKAPEYEALRNSSSAERTWEANSLLLNNASGPLSTGGGGTVAWYKIPEAVRAQMSPNARAALEALPSDWPEVEFNIASSETALSVNATNKVMASVGVLLIAASSRGNLTIRSASNLDAPVINPNWLRDPIDQEVAVQGYKVARQALQSLDPSIRVGSEMFPGTNVTSDAQILEAVKSRIGAIHHAGGGCGMGKAGDPEAVVDSKGRVFGVQSLRVIDSSSFAFVPPGHTQGTTYAHAEKLVQDMLDEM